MAQTVKNSPAMGETSIPSLGGEDSLEEGITTHSIILAWRIPRAEKPGGLQSMGLQRVGQDSAINTFTFTYTFLLVIPICLTLTFKVGSLWVLFLNNREAK